MTSSGDNPRGIAYRLLSSGVRSRYIEDIVRALALPKGGVTRFRYTESLVPEAVRESFSAAKNVPAYLCFLDISMPGTVPSFVPVRRAVIKCVTKEGSSFIVDLEAREFLKESAENEIQKKCLFELPVWDERDAATGRWDISGAWVADLKEDLDKEHFASSSDRGAFESTVVRLLEHRDFNEPDSRFFFHLLGIKEVGRNNIPKKEYLDISSGVFRLDAFQRYQIDVYHYFPDEGHDTKRPTYWLGIRSSGKGVVIDGRSAIKADSEYDIKGFRVRGATLALGTYDEVEVYRTTDPDDHKALSAEISVPIYASPSIWLLAF